MMGPRQRAAMLPHIMILLLAGSVSLEVSATTSFTRYHRNMISVGQSHHHHRRITTLAQSGYQAFTESLFCRGGSTRTMDSNDDDENDGDVVLEDPEEVKKRVALKKWRMDQQMLMQLRSTFLTEALAKRGVPLATILDVSTADGDKKPDTIDWDCAMSTAEEPKTCLYSFDAEPNTKVVAPISTTQWITLSALNRLRRTDPTKVEPMWHSQYAILESWFGDDSEYSLLQHVGIRGFIITVLLDTARGAVLKSLLVMGILSVIILFMPFLEYIINRSLVSGAFWAQWRTWSRIVHAALPLKLLLGQLAWKFLAKSFGQLEGKVRDYIVDMECAILEESIPLTVGPGSEVLSEQEEEVELGVFEEQGEERDDEDSSENEEYEE